MPEFDDEIREIKKEIIEARGLIIKTNNLTNALAADIKSIAKRQAGYERRFNWNSGVAYVLFAALSFVGLKLAADARIDEHESEAERLAIRVSELEEELAALRRGGEERMRAELAAADYYGLIRQQKRADVVRGFPEISRQELSRAEAAFFRDTVDRFREDLSVSEYQAGLELMRTGRYAEAAEKFEQAIQLGESAAHLPSVKFNLASALRHLGRPAQAMVYVRQVIEQTGDRDLHPQAMWLLSLCAEDLDDLDTARESLHTLMRRWPRSSYVSDARSRIRDLNQRVLRNR